MNKFPHQIKIRICVTDPGSEQGNNISDNPGKQQSDSPDNLDDSWKQEEMPF